MRTSDLSPDRRRLLALVPSRENVKALVLPPCPRVLDATLVLIRQLHRVLASGAGYPHPEGPGERRRMQNWIGGHRIEDATLIPPPVPHLEACLLDLEDFLWVDASSPNLTALPLRMAVAHVQFEAIHPFSDGNGHVGRLLPPLMMAAESLPPLYLAGYLKTHQRECYDGLAGVQLRGHWIDSLGFFLDGIAAAAATAQSLLDVRRSWQGRTAHLRADAAARRRSGADRRVRARSAEHIGAGCEHRYCRAPGARHPTRSDGPALGPQFPGA